MLASSSSESSFGSLSALLISYKEMRPIVSMRSLCLASRQKVDPAIMAIRCGGFLGSGVDIPLTLVAWSRQ